MSAICTVDSPIGLLSLRFEADCLTEIELFNGTVVSTDRFQVSTPGYIKQQFDDYFSDPEFRFDLPYRMQGTSFQRRVWQEMLNIAVGQTLSYGAIASKLNSSARAVGNACRANPLPIIVPCHRVVGRDGIGGFGGHTSGRQLDVKRWLLNHEGAVVKGL